MRKIFVTGIGTDVGKTIASAIITEALQADYWKPIQAGLYPLTDKEKVKSLISNKTSVFHPESYLLKEPMSPHAAAEMEGVTIDLNTIIVPATKNTLIIEGAGGIMVPINNHSFVLDLIEKLNAEVVLVVQNYLGCINHSLLTINALKQKGIKITGLIFNGAPHPSSHEIILTYSQLPCIVRIEKESNVDQKMILKYVPYLKNI